MTTLRIDIETFSSVDLRKAGVHRYVEAEDFEITLFGYAYGDASVNVIDLASGQALPQHVLADLTNAEVTKIAFNAAFEMACIARHFGMHMDPVQWQCTSVHALYLGLPGNLGDVGRVLGLAQDKQKLGVGGALIRYFCIPCKPTKTNDGRLRNRPHHDPAKWQLFKDYCARDVETEREVARRLAKFPVPASEWALWQLDQQMMNHGVLVNRWLINRAIQCDELHKGRLLAEAVELTGLDNPNSRDQLLAWLQEETDDDSIEDLTKKTVPRVLAATDDETVKRVLRLRQELAKTSVTKYQAMARAVCDDDRVRGLTQFYGANRTGRWAGRLVQVQNLPQNKLKDLDLARELVLDGQFESLEMLFGVSDTLSQLIRTAFIAPPGHRLIVVDFSAIEARVVAWLAWCQWRLEVFETHGKIYEASAEQMFKLPPGSVTKKSPYRQRGKVAELALGYQGGANALKTMGALEMGVPEDELEDIKNAWRQANPEVVDLWYACERAAKHAVGQRTTVSLPMAAGRAKLSFIYDAGFLFIQLPSGRRLSYVKPRIEVEDLVREMADGSQFVVAKAGALTYEGTDQKTKRWTRLSSYGGKLVENITQAIARDCLAEAMTRIAAAGYQQLMTIHDEIVIEAQRGVGSLADVEALMGRPIGWAPDLPLRGDGFETGYYMKEID